MLYNEFSSCVLCQSPRISVMQHYERAYLSKCSVCSLVFVKRIPTEEELVTFYEAATRQIYLSPITIKRYNELLDEFEKYRQTNNLLDVGCGDGYFLEQAVKRGWNVYGTDYAQKAFDICTNKGIRMHLGELNAENYEPLSFDVITSFEVIEHINTPKEEIAKYAALLRQHGLAYITTPNFNSLTRLYMKQAWENITYPEHLCYFTRKTLTSLFRKNGFRKVKVRSTGFSITRFKNSTKKKPWVRPVSDSSPDEQLRLKIEEKWYMNFLKNVVNGVLSFFGIGDTLKGYYIKK